MCVCVCVCIHKNYKILFDFFVFKITYIKYFMHVKCVCVFIYKCATFLYYSTGDRVMAVPSGRVVTAMWHLYPCQGQMAFSKHVAGALRTIWPNCHKIVLSYMQSACPAVIYIWPDDIKAVCETIRPIVSLIPSLPPPLFDLSPSMFVYAVEWKDQLCGRDACEIPAV